MDVGILMWNPASLKIFCCNNDPPKLNYRANQRAGVIVESKAKNSAREALSNVVPKLLAFQRSAPLSNETATLIVPVQILRGVAAVMVAAAHIPQIDTFLPISRYGAVGVDLFFVISGFIMVHSSRDLYSTADGYRIFFARRIAKIVPIYWLVSFWMCAFYLINAGPGVPKVTWSWMLSSLSFVPFGDGAVEPITGVGWTLNYEMFFYVCFAVTLAWSAALSALITTVTFLAFSALWIAELVVSPFSFWFNPIILEFVFGIWLGIVHRAGFRLSPVARTAAIAAGACLFVLSAVGGYYATPSNGAALRFLVWGVPALFIVAGCALGAAPIRRHWLWVLVLLGDASYCLYLVHPFLGFWTWWHLIGLTHLLHLGQIDALPLAIWVRIALTLIVVILASIVIHISLERPLTGWARGLLSSPPLHAGPKSRP